MVCELLKLVQQNHISQLQPFILFSFNRQSSSQNKYDVLEEIIRDRYKQYLLRNGAHTRYSAEAQ
jgi:hypothetical protein